MKSGIFTLKGILKGIQADKKLNENELTSLKEWLTVHEELRTIAYVSDLYYIIKEALKDGVLDPQEKEEILNYCSEFPELEGPINQMSREMLVLHGFMQGVAADEKINKSEVSALKNWMELHRTNIEKWPYNALNSILETAILNQNISAQIKEEILNFCGQFVHTASDRQLDPDPEIPDFLQYTKSLKTIDTIYDDDDDVLFKESHFCLSGNFRDLNKKELMEKIVAKGGIQDKSITQKTDYLVVGSISSALWKYSTYGLKVQKALEKKSQGEKIRILSEERLVSLL